MELTLQVKFSHNDWRLVPIEHETPSVDSSCSSSSIYAVMKIQIRSRLIGYRRAVT